MTALDRPLSLVALITERTTAGATSAVLQTRSFWFVFVLVTVLAGATLVVYTGPVVQEAYGGDVFVYIDGAWRVLQGQRPHVDFNTSLGFGFFLIVALGFKLFGLTIYAIPGLIALMAIVVALWCWVLASERMPPWLAGLLSTAVAFFCLSSAFLDHDFRPTTYAGYYNRLDHALLVILLVELLVPTRPGVSQLAEFAGGVSSGFILVTLTVTKMPFLLPAMSGLGLAAAFTRRPRSWWTGLAAALAAGFVATAIYLRGDPFSVVRDILFVAHARGGRVGEGTAYPLIFQMLHRDMAVNWGKVFEVVRLESEHIGMLILSALLTVAGGPLRREDKLNLLAIPVLLATSIGVILMSWQWAQTPTIAFLGVLLASATAQRGVEYGRAAEHRVRVWASFGVAALLCAQVILGAAIALFYAEARKRPAFLPPVWQEVRGDAFKGFYVTGVGNCEPESFAKKINDGMALLQSSRHEQANVMVFDFMNPFSFGLRRRSPRGDAVSWSHESSFSLRTFIPPDVLLRDVELVMIPKCPQEIPTVEDMLKLYGATVERDFQREAETTYWTLMARKGLRPD